MSAFEGMTSGKMNRPAPQVDLFATRARARILASGSGATFRALPLQTSNPGLKPWAKILRPFGHTPLLHYSISSQLHASIEHEHESPLTSHFSRASPVCVTID
jgi:hypothetical protein